MIQGNLYGATVLQVNFAAAPMLGTAVQRGYLTRRTLLIIGLLVVGQFAPS